MRYILVNFKKEVQKIYESDIILSKQHIIVYL